MSFILDALKKAEAERQRQTGPTLLEVRVAQPRRRFPTWTLVIGSLLAINILLLIAFEMHRPAPVAEPAASASPAVTAPVTAAPAAAPAAAPPAAAAPATASPAAAPAMNAATASNATTADQSGDNPADFEPAVSPSGSSSAANSSARRARPPSLSDVSGDVPDLRLDLHVYAVRPEDRYALINMHRVHEGDVLPEGARVVAIDRDGVELSYNGIDFMLHPQ